MAMNRRQVLAFLAALNVLPKTSPAGDLTAAAAGTSLIGAAWRGPNKSDPYHAGVLAADWHAEKLTVRYSLPLPTRPHGITAEADGGLLVIGVRPGTWLLRCDKEGRVVQQVRGDDDTSTTRLNGHAAAAGDVLYTTETDIRSGRGRIGVRDRRTLKKLDEWDTHGIDPHQLILDHRGQLFVANGGVPRTLSDKKYDLHRMESSLVRLDGRSGRLLRQWRLEDPRLSLRHLAWSHDPAEQLSPDRPNTVVHPLGGLPRSGGGTYKGEAYLGIAIQAEHDDPAARAAAPLLAVLDGDVLRIPSLDNDGVGYAGDIAPAYDEGFAVSSHQAGLVQLWHPGAASKLTSIITFKEAAALTGWPGPEGEGGLLVATAYGVVRWRPTTKAAFLLWPEPMALDNHWVLVG
jgi:hypothetical protein